MMAVIPQKFVVKTNETLGRYVEASEDIPAGSVILSERPLVILPQWNSTPLCCNCFQFSMRICTKCKIFPLCSKCTSHKQSDCSFFETFSTNENNFLLENYAIFGPLKCLLLMESENDEESWKKFLEMESHIEQRKTTGEWKEYEMKVVKPLEISGILNHFTKIAVNEELIQRICGILDVNAFEIRGPGPEPLRAAYPVASLLAHDCVANTMITVDNSFGMKIYSSVPIKKGAIIYYNYTNPLLGTAMRQAHLKIGKYFECACVRCSDPTELGSFMSALRCEACNQGYLLPMKHLWNCNHCSNTMQKDQVENTVCTVKNDIIEADGDLQQMEYLLMKYEEILHPNHYWLIDLKQNIASILRSICNTSFPPSKLVLERKLQLCEDILTVLRIILPGISRLKAIALYEYSLPFIQLAFKEFEDSNTSAKEFLFKLEKGESLLKWALQMLLYEPVDTPEGQLAKRAIQDMKKLRTKIAELKEQINSAENDDSTHL